MPNSKKIQARNKIAEESRPGMPGVGVNPLNQSPRPCPGPALRTRNSNPRYSAPTPIFSDTTVFYFYSKPCHNLSALWTFAGGCSSLAPPFWFVPNPQAPGKEEDNPCFAASSDDVLLTKGKSKRKLSKCINTFISETREIHRLRGWVVLQVAQSPSLYSTFNKKKQ